MKLLSKSRDAEATRRKVIETAFGEIYRNGFQGASVNTIAEETGLTKGALFHYFASKQALGYAVVDEYIGPLLLQRWLDPLRDSDDPIRTIRKTCKRYVKEDIASGHFVFGCPLNNLAQEMSPLDKEFHKRLNTLYDTWRSAYAEAIRNGIKNRTVRDTVSPKSAAALIVAAQMGIWGTGKSSQDAERMQQAGDALCDYLDTLRASFKPTGAKR
ncbi:MAG: TetR/AcrR family transcriptional regulator [Acidobacteria bacterium]|nr:TetR/AcrR family transcriptional regulator [Acidobacteriota bacterium]